MAEKTEAEKTAEERRTKALENLTAAFENLKGKVEKQAQPKADEGAKKPRIYSRAELRKAVNDGTLTEDQMDEILERQNREAIRAEFKTELQQTTEQTARNTKISAQIDALTDAHPELKDQTSDKFKKVAAKFAELVANGAPKDDLLTEKTAIELALGTGGKPRERKRELEATEETGGAGGGDHRNADEDDGPWKGIPQKNRDYYKRQIAKGIYSGASDARLKKELDRLRKAN